MRKKTELESLEDLNKARKALLKLDLDPARREVITAWMEKTEHDIETIKRNKKSNRTS